MDWKAISQTPLPTVLVVLGVGLLILAAVAGGVHFGNFALPPIDTGGRVSLWVLGMALCCGGAGLYVRSHSFRKKNALPQPSKGKELEYYHYVDDEALKSLFAQCEGARGRNVKLVEQRIPIIMSFLQAQGKLQRLSMSSETADAGYVFLEAAFAPPNFDEVLEKAKSSSMSDTSLMFAAFSGNREALKPKGFAQFSSICAFGTVTMGSSLAKYRTGLHHLLIGWDATQPSALVGLRVFGDLSRQRSGGFYLKPFFIARA